ncbi:MAG: hypothetical protein WCF22_00565, partial [Candidatus Sulfotelmatobacter sp.]
MAISVGDATLTFLGDTTKLDTTLNSIGPKAKAAMQPAQDAADDLGDSLNSAGKQGEQAFNRVGKSARGATEQVRFLGEETGVRLPRAMAALVADLPGVGAALNAAFTITAIIYAVREINDLTNKLADWVYGVKDASKFNEEWNQSIGAASKEAKDASRALADYGKSADDLAREHITELVAAINDHTRAAEEAKFEMSYLTKGTDAYNEASRQYVEQTKLATAATDEHTLAVKKLLDAEAEEARAKNLEQLKTELALRTKLASVQISYLEIMNGLSKDNADELRYQLSIKALQEQASAESKYGKDSVAKVKEINAQIEELQVEHTKKMLAELNQEKEQTTKLLDDMSKSLKVQGPVDIVQPAVMQKLLAFRKEVSELGVTLDTDLAQKIALVKKALADYAEQGGKDVFVTNQLKEKLTELERQYADFPNQEKYLRNQLEQAKAAHQNTKAIEQQIAALNRQEKALGVEPGLISNIVTQIQQLKTTSTSAFMTMESSFSSAMQGMIQGQESFGAAMEKSTFKMLGSMAQQWALYYLALAVGNMFTDPAAAAEELAAGTALEALAGVLNGMRSGGSGGSGVSAANGNSRGQFFQYGSSVSNTGSQAGSGRTTNVQGFATGALITRPTLATFAESGPEVAIPLNDPRAKKAVNEAFGVAGGGDIHNHFHIKGMVSDDTIAGVVAKINKKVRRGQLT